MAPTPSELNIIAGDKVRLKPDFMPEGRYPREVYFVSEALAPGKGGH